MMHYYKSLLLMWLKKMLGTEKTENRFWKKEKNTQHPMIIAFKKNKRLLRTLHDYTRLFPLRI